MSKTKYIKVPVSERLPENAGYYFIVNKATGKQSGYYNGITFHESFVDPEYFLEEVPDIEDEMRVMLEKIREDQYSIGEIDEQTFANLEQLLNTLK